MNGLDVDFVIDHLLSLEDSDNFDLINKLSNLWEVYNESWNKFNKFLLDFWKVMNDIEKLDSFDKTCKKIIEAWYDDIEDIFYSDDDFENLKLNYGFKGNDIFEIKESVRKNVKESKDTDFFNAMSKKFNFTKDEIKKYKDKTYISVIGILFDRIRSIPTHSDEWYNAMNDCWEGIQVAEDNGFNVDYEKKTYDKIIMTPNYNRESKKSARKSMKESKDKFIIWSNEGYLDFEGEPSDNISDDEYYMIFDTEKEAEEYINELKKEYDNEWSDSLEVHTMW